MTEQTQHRRHNEKGSLKKSGHHQLLIKKSPPELPSLDVDWLCRSGRIDASLIHTNTADTAKPEDPINVIHSAQPSSKNHEAQRKRRSSIAASNVTPEQHTYSQQRINDITSMPLRKTKSSPTATKRLDQQESSAPKKLGFFKKLFGGGGDKRESKNKPEAPSRRASLSRIKTTDPTETENSILRRRPSINKKDTKSEKHIPPSPQKSFRESSTEYSNGSINAEEDLENIRLLDFIKYYKANGYRVSAFKLQGKSRQPARAEFSIDGSVANDAKSETDQIAKLKYDVKGRPLPSHPNKAKLPPAIKNYDASNNLSEVEDNYYDSESSSNAPQLSSSKFGAFLKKVKSYGAENNDARSPTDLSKDSSLNSSLDDAAPNDINYNAAKPTVIPGLENMKPLKHVSFATNTYFNDPPQQICSKNPRKGEVEVKPNGSVIIHRLTPEQKRKILESTTTGMVVGGSGQLKLLSTYSDNTTSANEPIDTTAIKKREQSKPGETLDGDIDSDPEQEEQKRHLRVVAAETAAEARGKAGPNELTRIATNNEDDVTVSSAASSLKIDKPMLSRKSTGIGSTPSLVSMMSKDSFDGEIFPPKDIQIPHDVVYTRCCHLREILPIPATLKQLKKGSTEPIPLLQLRNPRPSLVEIWSFSDFLSIAPVLCVSLDGVSLSTEMFRIILCSLVNKPNFEKLSLRNTKIDSEGWKLLCFFVSKSKSLTALDISMVPGLKTNVQKPSKSSLKSTVVRMECNEQNRSDMNWNLMTASIAQMGGLEEIIISGAKMSSLQLKNFIEVGCVATERLGLAYNDLSVDQCETLASWLVQSNVTGLDVGFNDLKGKLHHFSNAVWDKIQNKRQKNSFKYISLNDTNLEVNAGESSENNEVLRLISILCYCEKIKFLDLSNNPKMFPHCIRTLINCLPVFVNLVRLHLDFERLNSTEIVMLAEILPLCSRLNYLSMLGNDLDFVSYKALSRAVRKSNSLITLDINYDKMPEEMKNTLSIYTMRNVQKELNRVKASGPSTEVGKKDQLMNLQEELSTLLTQKFEDTENYKALIDDFIQKLLESRSKIKKVVQDLFDIRVKRQLNTEGKETLIRLCFVDACFEKGIRLLRERDPRNVAGNKDPAAPPLEEIPSGSSITMSRNTRHAVPTIIEPSMVAKRLRNDSKKEIPRQKGVPTGSTFLQSGHSALLPFGAAEVEESYPNAEEITDFRNDMYTDTSQEVSHQIREEGNVFKKSADIMKQLESSISHPDQSIDSKALGEAAENFNSDQIKEFLLKNDISTAVNVIDELHNQGYHLHDIFKKQGGTKKSVPDTLQQSQTTTSTNNNNNNTTMHPQAHEEEEEEEEKEAIDAVYDEVLDNLQQARINMAQSSVNLINDQRQ